MLRILSFLLLTVLLNVSFVEASEIRLEGHSKVDSIESLSSVAAADHCDDCEENECSDEGNCCQSICSCSSALYIKPNLTDLNTLDYNSIVTYRHLSDRYLPPFLDRDIKPPFLS